MYKSYGLRSTILVREFISGVYPESAPPTALQRIAVALAYPAGCFLLYALLYYSNQQYGWSKTSDHRRDHVQTLDPDRQFWGIITLLPIFPYPGGRVMLEVLTLTRPAERPRRPRWSSRFSSAWHTSPTPWPSYFGKIREVEIAGGVLLPATSSWRSSLPCRSCRTGKRFQYIRSSGRGYQDAGGRRTTTAAPWER